MQTQDKEGATPAPEPVPPFRVQLRSPGEKSYRVLPARFDHVDEALTSAREFLPQGHAGLRVVDSRGRVQDQLVGGRPAAAPGSRPRKRAHVVSVAPSEVDDRMAKGGR
jgi:hypothetical protein